MSVKDIHIDVDNVGRYVYVEIRGIMNVFLL